MSSAVVGIPVNIPVNPRNGTVRKRRNRRRRGAQSTSNVVVVPQGQQRPRRRRRRNRSGRRRNRTGRQGGRNVETFVFNKDSVKDSSSGTITFGPSLSESVALSGGVLKAYHQYKITMVNLRFVSESSSTAEGSIAYEVDPHCKLSTLGSTLRRFPISKGGQTTLRAAEINGIDWHDSEKDQFKLHYKGNGTTGKTAGFFQIRYSVALQGPK